MRFDDYEMVYFTFCPERNKQIKSGIDLDFLQMTKIKFTFKFQQNSQGVLKANRFKFYNRTKNKLNQQKFICQKHNFKFKKQFVFPAIKFVKYRMIPYPIQNLSLSLLITILAFGVTSLRIHNRQSQLLHTQTQKLYKGFITHTQTDSPIYDEQKYLVDLAQKQNAFKQQLTEIQTGFAGINMMLNDTNLSQNQKNIKLSEALADERDSLISVQSQLNLQYELKSCQCLNLTQLKKQQLSQQLDKVKAKIAELQKSTVQTNKHCESHDCPLIKQLNNQLQMMKSYQAIMENIINSKCCDVVKYAYRDNLDVADWHWGNTTQSDYQAQIFQRQQNSEFKLQPCPYSQPWVKLQQNTCFSCPSDKPLYNIGMRQCQKDCTEYSKNAAFILNVSTHVCGFNTNCPAGQFFDQTLRKCSTTITYSNESSCPPSRPFWDPLSYSCQSCPSQTPFFDLVLKTCRKCNSDQTWNQNTRLCQSSQTCPDGYYFDSLTKNCLPQNTNTHSLCPPERPFWNQLTYSCDQCGTQKPYYDPAKRICRVCNQLQIFNQYSKQCTLKSSNLTCASDQFYNPQIKACEKRGTTSMCPPSTPYWDSKNFKCLQCPSSTPSFNEKTRQCQPCPLKHVWSNTYQQCIQSCPSGEEWNNDYKRCIKIDRTCLQKFAFSYDLNKCIQINCDQKNPFWNSTANLCQSCPPGTIYNYVTNNCEKDSRSGNVSVCHQDRPFWNPDYLRCEPCPEAKVWNSLQKACLLPSVTQPNRSHKKQSFSHEYGTVHNSVFKQGHVYGNDKVQYQYHDLSYLHE